MQACRIRKVTIIKAHNAKTNYVRCRAPTEIHTKVMLVDEEAADLVWEAWDSGVIDDELAAWAWLVIAV